MRNLGLGVLSALFCSTLIGACSASGNDPSVTGTGSGSTDSGAAADTSYTYEAGPSSTATYDSGSPLPPIDSGPVIVIDSGPSPTSNDCDLSGSGAETYITELASGGDGDCGPADACGTGDCCVNISSFLGGGGSIPAPILALLGGGSSTPSTCVAQ